MLASTVHFGHTQCRTFHLMTDNNTQIQQTYTECFNNHVQYNFIGSFPNRIHHKEESC